VGAVNKSLQFARLVLYFTTTLSKERKVDEKEDDTLTTKPQNPNPQWAGNLCRFIVAG
jgi:hypothetical protein